LIVADEAKLKLGKGAAFVKGRLKRLPQTDETWEADFQALPKPILQSETHYQGMVVARKGDTLLADSQVRGRPSVNDLATILAQAMRRPLDGEARRPKLVRFRGHHRWRELFPHLEEIGVGVEVLVGQSLPCIEKVYRAYLRRLRDEQRAGMVQPTAGQSKVESMFPAIARYVRGYGFIEIGDQESFGFVVRAQGYGGLDFEDERADTLAEAMAILEAGLARWFDEQVVDLE
jgi:hypothetical protein